MAIYVKGKKIEETEESVIYAYDEKPDNLTGQFKLYRDGSNWEVLKLADKDVSNWSASLIMTKVLRFYKENGYFPDEISRQS